MFLKKKDVFVVIRSVISTQSSIYTFCLQDFV